MAGRKWARGWALGPEDDVEPEPIEEAEEEEEDDEDDRLPAGGAAHLDEVVDADGAHVDAQRRRRRQHHEAQRVAPQRQPFPARRRAQKLQNTEQKKKNQLFLFRWSQAVSRQLSWNDGKDASFI